MRMLFLILILFAAQTVFAQAEYKKWHKKKADYTKPALYEESYKISGNFPGVISESLIAAYRFTVSSHDGDNCPYNPSCSLFFSESVRETNIFTGMLMFADRFTRDTNLFKNREKYHIYNGRFYDPVVNYLPGTHEYKFYPESLENPK